MPSILLYLLKCCVSLAIVWGFYQLLLRRLTFHTINRWYLLGYAALSFLLPLVHVALPEEGKVAGPVIRYIPVISVEALVRTEERVLSGWDIALWVAAFGALLLAARLLVRWLSLRRLRQEATLMRDGAVAVYQVDRSIIPFSFGNAIYINAKLHTEKEWEEIILHEYVHVRQRHTVDIILAELLCIVTWFNPFSWLVRHAIRQNLEFIADEKVLASGLDRKSYQYHLLKVIGEPSYRLVNNFNFSSLKKRIIMMNRSKSARLHLVKFLFIVPMLGALLVAFRDKVHVSLLMVAKGLETGNSVPEPKDTIPSKKQPSLVIRRNNDPKAPKPLIVIDEVEATEKQMKNTPPETINDINVLKDSSATVLFGPTAKGGVVLIYTKGYEKKYKVRLKDGSVVLVELKAPDSIKPRASLSVGDRSLSVAGGSSSVAGGSLSVDGLRDSVKDGLPDSTNAWLSKALIRIDGVEHPYTDVDLDPKKIERINVWKGQTALEKFGEKGRNGVVEVTTRTKANKGPIEMVVAAEGDVITVRADSVLVK